MTKLHATALALLPITHSASAAPLSDFCNFFSSDVVREASNCWFATDCDPFEKFPEVYERYETFETRAANYVLSKLSSSKNCMAYPKLLAGSGVENCFAGQEPFVWAIFDLVEAEVISSNNSNDPESWKLGMAENGECA
ncbi:MAG: hypothetical protein AAGB28_17425 [Pseudomonadota bacterium]